MATDTEKLKTPSKLKGHWGKIIAGLFLVCLIVWVGYYGYQRGFFITASDEIKQDPLEKPVKTVELPSEIRNMPVDKQFGEANQGNYEQAYAIYQHIIDTSPSSDYKIKARFFQAVLLGQYLKKPQLAKMKFKLLTSKYPQSQYVDDAYYYLGLINLDQNRLKQAVYNFTYLINNYPKSNQIENARFMASKCSDMLQKLNQKQEEQSFNLSSFIKELAPNNLLSLLAFVSALGSPLIWITMRLHDKEGRLILFTDYPDSAQMRRSKRIQWIMVATFFSLIATSFLINQHQKRQEFKQLLQMLQTSGIKADHLK